MPDCLEIAGSASELRSRLPLLRELNDLKRLYSANLSANSLATQIFRGACRPLSTGAALEPLPWASTAVAAARLGAITPESLLAAGVPKEKRAAIYRRSLAAHAGLSQDLIEDLTGCVDNVTERLEGEFAYAEDEWPQRLCRAPRAGATCPGKPRIVLEPAELHSDHCAMVAVYGFMLADIFGANRDDAWLIGLCHHFHNAYLPDSGFTGEMLLGDQLNQIIGSFRDQALREIHPNYRNRISSLFSEIAGDASPLAQTFHAADTIDRVVQMENYERAAQFRVGHALHDLELVHESPTQAFQKNLLKSIGLLPGVESVPCGE